MSNKTMGKRSSRPSSPRRKTVRSSRPSSPRRKTVRSRRPSSPRRKTVRSSRPSSPRRKTVRSRRPSSPRRKTALSSLPFRTSTGKRQLMYRSTTNDGSGAESTYTRKTITDLPLDIVRLYFPVLSLCTKVIPKIKLTKEDVKTIDAHYFDYFDNKTFEKEPPFEFRQKSCCEYIAYELCRNPKGGGLSLQFIMDNNLESCKDWLETLYVRQRIIWPITITFTCDTATVQEQVEQLQEYIFYLGKYTTAMTSTTSKINALGKIMNKTTFEFLKPFSVKVMVAGVLTGELRSKIDVRSTFQTYLETLGLSVTNIKYTHQITQLDFQVVCEE